MCCSSQPEVNSEQLAVSFSLWRKAKLDRGAWQQVPAIGDALDDDA